MFRVKVNIFHLGEDNRLQVKCINNSYGRTIEICRLEEHYDSVFGVRFIEDVEDV